MKRRRVHRGARKHGGLADCSARQQGGVGPILPLGPTGPMVNVTAERQWLTIAACPLRPWGPSGTWGAEVYRRRRPKGRQECEGVDGGLRCTPASQPTCPADRPHGSAPVRQAEATRASRHGSDGVPAVLLCGFVRR